MDKDQTQKNYFISPRINHFGSLDSRGKWELTFELIEKLLTLFREDSDNFESVSKNYINISDLSRSIKYDGISELFKSELFENFIDILANIVQAHSLRNEYIGIEDFELDNYMRFSPNEKGVCEKISKYWDEHRKPIYFSTLELLYDNFDLINLIAEKKIEFTTLLEPKTAPKICKLIHHLSDNYQQIKFGNPNLGEHNSNQSDKFAVKMGPILEALETEGYKSVRAKAKELNNRKIPTLRNKKWSHDTVQKTMNRWQNLKEEKEKRIKQRLKSPKPE